jgi:hypothetical protein
MIITAVSEKIIISFSGPTQKALILAARKDPPQTDFYIQGHWKHVMPSNYEHDSFNMTLPSHMQYAFIHYMQSIFIFKSATNVEIHKNLKIDFIHHHRTFSHCV